MSDITKRGKPVNVVIKLDITKAYEKADWTFFRKVLQKIGFDIGMVDMI